MNDIVGEKPIELPDGYTLGQYLNITGSTRVPDIESIAGSFPFDVEMKIAPSAFSTAGTRLHLAGIQVSFAAGIATDGHADCQAGANNKTKSDNVMFAINTDAVVNVHFETSNNKSTYFVDGVDTGLKGNSNNWVALFAINNYGANQFKGKVYYVKIYKNSKLVAHFVPVLGSDTSKTTVQNSQMYDIIRKKFMGFAVKNATVII
jgi:hypothetical protein